MAESAVDWKKNENNMFFKCSNKYRSRLSLDLSSPTSELPVMHALAANNNNNSSTARNTNNSTANNSTTSIVLSPRYSEFKMYNSAFDGLYALENNHLMNRIGQSDQSAVGADCRETEMNGGSAQNINQMAPLMRVASLPSISPTHSGKLI